MAFLLPVGKKPVFETAQHLGKKLSQSQFGFLYEVQLNFPPRGLCRAVSQNVSRH